MDTGFRDAALAAEMKVDLIPVEEELEKVFGGILEKFERVTKNIVRIF